MSFSDRDEKIEEKLEESQDNISITLEKQNIIKETPNTKTVPNIGKSQPVPNNIMKRMNLFEAKQTNKNTDKFKMYTSRKKTEDKHKVHKNSDEALFKNMNDEKADFKEEKSIIANNVLVTDTSSKSSNVKKADNINSTDNHNDDNNKENAEMNCFKNKINDNLKKIFEDKLKNLSDKVNSANISDYCVINKPVNSMQVEKMSYTCEDSKIENVNKSTDVTVNSYIREKNDFVDKNIKDSIVLSENENAKQIEEKINLTKYEGLINNDQNVPSLSSNTVHLVNCKEDVDVNGNVSKVTDFAKTYHENENDNINVTFDKNRDLIDDINKTQQSSSGKEIKLYDIISPIPTELTTNNNENYCNLIYSNSFIECNKDIPIQPISHAPNINNTLNIPKVPFPAVINSDITKNIENNTVTTSKIPLDPVSIINNQNYENITSLSQLPQTISNIPIGQGISNIPLSLETKSNNIPLIQGTLRIPTPQIPNSNSSQNITNIPVSINNISSSITKIPQVPGIPNIIPNIPQIPGIPQVPQPNQLINKIPNIPQIPGIPQVPQPNQLINKIPNIPQIAGIPRVPQVPGVPNKIPNIPQIPGIPQVPQQNQLMNKIPNIPQAYLTSVPGIPGIPKIPNSLPKVPGLPNLPHTNIPNPGNLMPEAGIPYPNMMINQMARGAQITPKPKVRTVQPMKPLYWIVVDQKKLPDTIWLKLDDSQFSINAIKFEDEFSQKKKESAIDKKDNSKQAPTIISKPSVLMPSRQQNINIVLSKLRLSPIAIVEALISYDFKILTSQTCDMLLSIVPTSAEINQVDSFDGDPMTLADSDQFVLLMKTAPGYDLRLKAILFHRTYKEDYEEILKRIQKFFIGFEFISENKKFHRWLEIVLAYGNYMNGSSNGGGAYGFRLDILSKIAELKSNDNKKNLMLYIVEYIGDVLKEDELLKINKQLEIFASLSFSAITDFSKEFNSKFKILTNLLQILEKDNEDLEDDDKSAEFLASFYSNVEDSVKKIEEGIKKIEAEYGILIKKFGDTTKDMPMETLIEILNKFGKDLTLNVANYTRARDLKEKMEKKKNIMMK